MQKPRNASATTLPQVVAVPRPPMPGASLAAPERHSYQGGMTTSDRSRRGLLQAPMHMPKYIYTEPASVPWSRSLRSTYDICATVPHNRQRKLKKTSEGPVLQECPQIVSAEEYEKLFALGCASFAANKLSMVKDEDLSQMNDGFGGGLSSSTLDPWSPRAPRHQSSQPSCMPRLQLDTAAIEDELSWLTNSKSENAVNNTNPQLDKFAAYHTLQLLFVPIWKLYRFRKQMAWATAIVAKYVLVKVHLRRQRRSEWAIDTLLHVLRIPRTKLRCAAHLVEQRVVRIQRSFRRHRARVHAVVELNYRKVRRDVEKAYWDTIVAQREAELAVQQRSFSPLPKVKRKVAGPRPERRTRFGPIHFLTGPLSSGGNSSSRASAPSYELDVYSFHTIGRLPESLIRFETASAVFAQLRRSAARAHLMDDFSETRARRAAMKGHTYGGDATPTKMVLVHTRGKCRAQLPRFLPDSVYTAILNNTCYVTSLMRGDPMLRAHLRQREHHLESY
ncbi:hypothetical protein, conserved [Leishmania tarentolae]|uniref:Uncharacterized protein n=1 Tax=Leishmania tarentolae TaxID=5689 RepID=A0A640KU17_LEITA|nr:hypothetical protein, conserved [Leishmania tarentolae]